MPVIEAIRFISSAILVAIAINGFGITRCFGVQSAPRTVKAQTHPKTSAPNREDVKTCLAEAIAHPQSPDAQYKLGRAY